ncbi:hypothetical protein FOZ62_004540, partial [Perkinsus olseni]
MIPHLAGDVPNPVVGVNQQQQQQPAGGGNLLFEAFFPQVREAYEGGAFFANLRPQRRAELQQELLIWDFFWRIANRAINRQAFRVAIDFLTTHYGSPTEGIDETDVQPRMQIRSPATITKKRHNDKTGVAGSSHWNGLPLDNLAGEGYNRILVGIQVPVYQ